MKAGHHVAPARVMAWSPEDAALSLVGIAFLERALAHILAGWAVKMPEFEEKLLFAIHMHHAMERASQWRSRIHGLCHAVAGEPCLSKGWQAALKLLDASPNARALTMAVYGILYPRLIEMCDVHARRTDCDGDRGSLDLLASFLPQLRTERREGLSLLSLKERMKAPTSDKAFEAFWYARHNGEKLKLEQLMWEPLDRVPGAVRPENSQFSPSGSLGLLPADPLHDAADIAMFLHKEMDEEFTTLELLARNSYEHPSMPWQFHRDMARQVADEARHARMIGRLMQARGVCHGQYKISTASYDGLYEFEPCERGSRNELLWRILIRQTFMEGLAIDHLALDIGRRKRLGQSDIAHVFEYILRDEVFHAHSGLRWSHDLLGSDHASVLEARREAFSYSTARAEIARERFVMENLDAAMAELAAIEAVKKSRSGTRQTTPLNAIGRKQAGFNEDDLDQVIVWGFASDQSTA